MSQQPVSKGVLLPGLQQPGVQMKRHPPAAALADVVTHYWVPRWNLPPGGEIVQRILQYPAANIVVEPESAALYGVEVGRGERTLSGNSWAFGVLLRPGAARAILGRPLSGIRDGRQELDATLGPEVPALVRELRGLGGSDADLIRAMERWLGSREELWTAEAAAERALVNDVVGRVAGDRGMLRVEELAEASGLGIRALQRLTREHIGVTPKWLIQRYRLQEAAHRLGEPDPPELAALAADLGYADQAHFSRDFARIIGTTPRRYAAHGLNPPRAGQATEG